MTLKAKGGKVRSVCDLEVELASPTIREYPGFDRSAAETFRVPATGVWFWPPMGKAQVGHL
jgi:hypothetical protein